MIQQSIKLVIFYSIIQIFVFQQLNQLTINVFVLLRIESERMYKMFQFIIKFFNRRSQDSIIIREQIFDLIRRKKSTIWKIYHLFMQLVNEFDEIVFLIDRRISNIRENMMKMLHSYELSFNCTREFNVILK
jgi:predicted GNAT family acetyltransferase